MRLKALQPRVKPLQARRPAGTLAVERTRGSTWMAIRARILARDCGICQPCKRDGHIHLGDEVDHRIPLWEGGSDADENLETICQQRHREKTAAEAARRR